MLGSTHLAEAAAAAIGGRGGGPDGGGVSPDWDAQKVADRVLRFGADEMVGATHVRLELWGHVALLDDELIGTLEKLDAVPGAGLRRAARAGRQRDLAGLETSRGSTRCRQKIAAGQVHGMFGTCRFWKFTRDVV